MSTFTRLSAAAASIFLISVVLGFELGVAAVAANDNKSAEIFNLPAVVSPGAGSQKNIKTRSIAGFAALSINNQRLTSSGYPAANSVGPAPGNVRVATRRSRSMISACLMAMN